MTDRAGAVEAEALSWPRAAIGAVLFVGLMIVFLVVIPNLLVGPDPSSPTKLLTIVYVVAIFALLAWMFAAWQNREQTASPQDSQRVSSFGRPMREGPGFASFEQRAASSQRTQPGTAAAADLKPIDNASSFGRPLKERSK